MTDVLDPASLLEAAHAAVDGGDYLAAERLLRDAARIQEANLGSLHPDLASTLNNLAFVCERTNNLAEAERGYRRAHAIAVVSLGPRHPFVATSVKNLVDFCAARGIPIWTPPATHSVGATSLLDFAGESEDDVIAAKDTPPQIKEATPPEITTTPDRRQEPVAVANRPTFRTIAVAAVGIAITVVVLVVMQSRETIKSPATVSESTAVLTPDPPPQVTLNKTPAPRADVKGSEARDTGVTPTPVTVLNAQLCSALEKRGSPEWRCASVNGDLQPGTYIFYTRLLTNADTTVEHRWYFHERLHQVMRLRVSANPASGYRTFSSNTVSRERAGEWKVEIRAADGTVLQQQHFVVR